MREITVKIHTIAEDGLPNMDDQDMVGRVAFIFDGCIVSGWPLRDGGRSEPDGDVLWEGDSDVAHTQPMGNVTHWAEFPMPIWELERETRDPGWTRLRSE